MFGLDKNDQQDDQVVHDAPVADNQTTDDQGAAAPAMPADEQANEYDITIPSEEAAVPATPVSESVDAPAEDTEAAEEDSAVPVNVVSSSSTPSDLSDLKQEALKELSSLVGKLDQSPEEKLKTIYDIYEATNDKALLKSAFEAAKELSDDTARANALLDLVHKMDEAS